MAIEIKWNTEKYTEDDVATMHILKFSEEGVKVKGEAVATAKGNAGTITVGNDVHQYGNEYTLDISRDGGVIASSSVTSGSISSLPGPTRLIQGDMELGWFGTLNSPLPSMINHWLYASTGNLGYWQKFAYKGDIIYVPMGTGLSTASVSLGAAISIDAVTVVSRPVGMDFSVAGSQNNLEIGGGFKCEIVVLKTSPDTRTYDLDQGIFKDLRHVFATFSKSYNKDVIGLPRLPFANNGTPNVVLTTTEIRSDGVYTFQLTFDKDGNQTAAVPTRLSSIPNSGGNNSTTRVDYLSPFWYIRVYRDDE